MWTQLTVKLNGIAPLIMHNGQLADPLNPGVKEMKKVSGKRNKTDADFEELARLEFQGSLYMGKNGEGLVPVIPGRILEATIVNGAKKSRHGLRAKAGMFVDENFPLEYEGPKDREGLWADENFRFVAPVRVSTAKVMRTRPYFEDWAVTATINYDDNQIDKRTVMKWLEDAGREVGLCDWRPRYGRFEVEEVK